MLTTEIGKIKQQTLDFESQEEETVPLFITKRKTVSVSLNKTQSQRNKGYFAAPIFSRHSAKIIKSLEEQEIQVALTEVNKWIVNDLTIFLIRHYKSFSYRGKSISFRPPILKKGFVSPQSAINDLSYKRLFKGLKKEDINLLENIYEELLEYGYKLFEFVEDIYDYTSFAKGYAQFFARYYNGEASKGEIVKKAKNFLEKQKIKIDLSNPDLVVEIVSFFEKCIRQERDITYSLEEVFYIYSRFGQEGFPWKLGIIREISETYDKKSDFSKIEKRGVKEETPCKHNNCGGMYSIRYLDQTRSADEGKTSIKFCMKCGKARS